MPGLMAVCTNVWSRSTIKASLCSLSNRSWSCLAKCSASCTTIILVQFAAVNHSTNLLANSNTWITVNHSHLSCNWLRKLTIRPHISARNVSIYLICQCLHCSLAKICSTVSTHIIHNDAVRTTFLYL